MGSRGSSDREGAELDGVLEDFERFAVALVRLEPCSLEEVRRRVERFASAVETHLEARRDLPSGTGSAEGLPTHPLGRIALEHERFRSSVEQLRGLLAVVEGDDHGGHRQALGQYGRIFTEALRSHRADERAPGPPREPRARPARLRQP
jgi:hypothetical protein